MTETTFFHAVNRIVQFLGGTREVPMHTKMAWLEKVKNIPDEAVEFIVGRITEEVDAVPRNMPKAFREKFRLWQMENPEKTAQIVQKGCPDCELGILFLEREGKTAAVFCQCYDGDTGAIGRTTLAWMQRHGWRSTKADKLGPEYGDKAAIKAQMAQARRDDRHPDPARYDSYEDQYAEGWL